MNIVEKADVLLKLASTAAESCVRAGAQISDLISATVYTFQRRSKKVLLEVKKIGAIFRPRKIGELRAW